MFFNIMELLSRLELPNLFITNEVLYLLSYASIALNTIIIIPDIIRIVKYKNQNFCTSNV